MTVGSVKSCYGHTEGTAGLTGSLLAMQSLAQQVGHAFVTLRLCQESTILMNIATGGCPASISSCLSGFLPAELTMSRPTPVE